MSDRTAMFTAFDCNYTSDGYQCSVCGKTFDVPKDSEWHQKKVCLHCGATEEKMSDPELMSIERLSEAKAKVNSSLPFAGVSFPTDVMSELIETARAAHHWKAKYDRSLTECAAHTGELMIVQKKNEKLRVVVANYTRDWLSLRTENTDLREQLKTATAKERERCAVTAWKTGMELNGKCFEARNVGALCAQAIRKLGDAE